MRTILIICSLFAVGFCDSLTMVSSERSSGGLAIQSSGTSNLGKREYLRELMQKKQDTAFTLNTSLEGVVTDAINDGDAFVIKEALNVSGAYKIKANRAKILKCAYKADSISPMYSAHIRQSAIKALYLLGGDSLNVTFKDLLQERRKFWFEGDFIMILQGLYKYGDSSALDLVVSLKDKIQRYKTEDTYYLQQRSVLLYTLANVENRLRER